MIDGSKFMYLAKSQSIEENSPKNQAKSQSIEENLPKNRVDENRNRQSGLQSPGFV